MNEEKITESINNSEGAQGTGAENSAGASAAVESSVATENSSADNATNGEGASGSEKKEAEGASKEGAVEKAPKQDSAKNAEFARKRREAEKEEAVKKARVDAIKEVLGTNPYTKKPIEDADDVEEYLLMKQIENDGKDPIADYPEYVKKQAREKSSQNARAQSTNDKVTKDLEEFANVHPNVDVNEVLQDSMFMSFAEGKLGKKSLSEVYSQYLPIKEAIAGAKREEDKAAHAKAVAGAAVGSLTNSSAPPEGEFFTKEQVLKMSPKEVHDNYEKIRKSQERW